MDSITVLAAKGLFIPVLLGALLCGALLQADQRKQFFLWAALAGVFALGLTKLAGMLYFDPRPFTRGVHALMPHEPDNGFPSDHTVLSTVAALLVFRYNRKLGVWLFILALCVGASRVAAGIHAPLDIVAAVAIGTLAVASTLPIVEKFQREAATDT